MKKPPTDSLANRLIVLVCTLAFLGTSPLLAEDAAEPQALYEALVEAAADTSKDFIEAYDQARDGGVPLGKLIAARALHQLVRGDMDGLLALRPRLQEHLDDLPVGREEIFTYREEAQGLILALQAVEAFQKESMEEFESLAVETFRTWPVWAQIFGLVDMYQHLRVEQVQTEMLKDLTVPMEQPLLSLEESEASLASLVEGKKGILLDFWAAWCGPCIRLMPELQKKAETLGPQGIVVVGVNTDAEDPVVKARRIQEEHNMEMTWMLEPKDRPLSNLLQVDSIPRMILLSPEGEVLFNGHPMSPKLDEALARLID